MRPNISAVAAAWIAALSTASVVFAGCAADCNGRIETTVLYAKPGPRGVGRSVYVDVVNQPKLGRKQTLLYEGKEFGTFEHVVIISDPESRFAGNRTICFDTYRTVAAEPGGALEEVGISRIQPDK